MLLLLSFLCSFLSITLALAFVALALLSWIICGVLTIRLTCPTSNSGMLWLTYLLGVAVVILVGRYTFPLLFLRSVGDITASFMGKTVALQKLFDMASNSFKSDFAEVGASGLGEFISKAAKQGFNELIPELWEYMYNY